MLESGLLFAEVISGAETLAWIRSSPLNFSLLVSPLHFTSRRVFFLARHVYLSYAVGRDNQQPRLILSAWRCTCA